MTWYENSLGTFCEIIAFFFFLRLFCDDYRKKKAGVIMTACLSAAVNTLCRMHLYCYWMEFFCALLVLVTALKLLREQTWMEAFFQYMTALLLLSFVEAVLVGIFNLFHPAASISAPVRWTHLTLLLLFSFWLGTRTAVQDWWRMLYEKYRQILQFIFGNLLVVTFMELYLWNSKNQLFYQEIGLIAVVLTLWIAMNLFLLKSLLENRKRKEQLAIHANYIDMIEDLLDELHGEKHEFRKHLQTLEGLSYGDDARVAVEAMQQYLEGLHGTEEQRLKKKNHGYLTGNRAVNALLYMKEKEAKEQGIRLFYTPAVSFPPVPCSEYELIEILGNLLNNAFEHTADLPVGWRKVFLRIEEHEGQARIEVRNPFFSEKEVSFEQLGQKGYSTKGGRERGYGLYHAKKLVERYGGSVHFFQKGDFFVAQVIF